MTRRAAAAAERSLLPPNATVLERGMERATARTPEILVGKL